MRFKSLWILSLSCVLCFGLLNPCNAQQETSISAIGSDAFGPLTKGVTNIIKNLRLLVNQRLPEGELRDEYLDVLKVFERMATTGEKPDVALRALYVVMRPNQVKESLGEIMEMHLNAMRNLASTHGVRLPS